MASIYKDFWINRAESRLQVGKNNSAYVTGLSFKRGDTVQMDVCLVEQDGTNYANVPFANTATIKAAIGVVDTAPTSGYFVVSYGGTDSGSINYDATATTIQTTLNAVTTISSAGGVTVSIVGNQYRITFNNVGARSALEWVSDTFLPPATTRITVLDAGSATSRSVQVIKLVSQPFSFTDVFTDIPDATASLSVVTAWASGKSIYNVSWSPTAIAGSVDFTVNGVTKQIQFDASEASWTTAGYTAIKAGINSFDVTILTASAPTVSVSDTTLYGRKGLRGIIGLNTAELEAYFTSNEAINAYLEIEVLDSGVKDTAVQQSVTIFPDIINGSETVPTPLSVCATEAQFNALAADVALAEGNALAAQSASADALILAQNLEIDVETLQNQMPSSDVRDALAASNAPTALNPFATVADLGGGGSGGPFLALAGGTMTGAITFDATGLQNINKGTFDNSTGGYNGISLTCAVGYELNWQGGHLGNWYSGAFQPIHLDSLLQSADATYDSEMGAWGFGAELTADTTQNAFIAHNEVRVENSAGGTSITPTGITFPDSTTLSTAPSAGVTYKQTLALAQMVTGNAPAWNGSYYVCAFSFPVGTGTISNDWTTGKFKVRINGYLFSFNYISSGAQYLNTLDDSSTVSTTGTGETLYLHYDGETSPYPFLIT